MAEIFIGKIDLEQIEDFFDLASEDPDYFREGRNLDASEREIVKKQDIWFVSYINKLPRKWKGLIGNCFLIPNLGDYNGLQRNEWLKKSGE